MLSLLSCALLHCILLLPFIFISYFRRQVIFDTRGKNFVLVTTHNESMTNYVVTIASFRKIFQLIGGYLNLSAKIETWVGSRVAKKF